jgi:hypothetical protein
MFFTGSVVFSCSLVHWFIGSLVRLLVVVVWIKFTILGPRGYSRACSCFLVGLVLVVFFCLLRICKVGVLRQ